MKTVRSSVLRCLCLVAAALLTDACASLPKPPWASGMAEDELARQRATREQMERTIRGHLGVRYHLGGTTRRGIDCSGFTSAVYQSAGVQLPRTASEQYREGRSVSRSELQFGDLLFFNTKRFATSPMACLASTFCPRIELPWAYGITHAGIYVGDGKFAHASTSEGVTFTNLEHDYWGPRYVGARRLLPDWDVSLEEAMSTERSRKARSKSAQKPVEAQKPPIPPAVVAEPVDASSSSGPQPVPH